MNNYSKEMFNFKELKVEKIIRMILKNDFCVGII